MRVAVGCLLGLGLCFAQSGTPSFEVASVKPAAPPSDAERNGARQTSDPGTLRDRAYTLKTLLSQTYGLSELQISGPGWLDSARYDIVAKIPAGATKEQINLMLRNLLAERFGLVTHMETREGPIYEATVAKGGVKMREPEKPGSDGAQPTKLDNSGCPTLPAGSPRMFGTQLGERACVVARMQTLQPLFMTLQLPTNLGRLIMDKTGLTGVYDYTLSFAVETASAQPGGELNAASDPAPTLLVALERQLGVKLESKKAPVETLVVDRANRTPTEN